MSRFISDDRSTEYLLPPSVEDGLPENHLARFVVDVVERLDLSALICELRNRKSVDTLRASR